jgi:hypothetical protein
MTTRKQMRCQAASVWLLALIAVIAWVSIALAELIEPTQTCPPNTCAVMMATTSGQMYSAKMMCSTVCVGTPIQQPADIAEPCDNNHGSDASCRYGARR